MNTNIQAEIPNELMVSKYKNIYEEEKSNYGHVNATIFGERCRLVCFSDCETRAQVQFKTDIGENREKYLTVCYGRCAATCQQRFELFSQGHLQRCEVT